MVGSIKYSEIVFLFNSNLVGSIFAFSEFVNPVSRCFFLCINSSFLCLSECSGSFFSNSFSSSFGVGLNSFSGGASLKCSIRVKPIHSSVIGQRVGFSIFILCDALLRVDGSLNFIGVNDSCDVSVSQKASV